MSRVDPSNIEQVLESRPVGHRRLPAIATGIVVLLLLVVLAWRMVPHPVGPARSFGKYRGKAVTTAAGAESELATALLVARAASAGNAFGPYTGLVLSDAEASVSGLQGTFDSIQPPDTRSDRLRDELDQLLGDATSHASRLRIAARRGELGDLAEVARPLVRDVQALRSFMDANQ